MQICYINYKRCVKHPYKAYPAMKTLKCQYLLEKLMGIDRYVYALFNER